MSEIQRYAPRLRAVLTPSGFTYTMERFETADGDEGRRHAITAYAYPSATGGLVKYEDHLKALDDARHEYKWDQQEVDDLRAQGYEEAVRDALRLVEMGDLIPGTPIFGCWVCGDPVESEPCPAHEAVPGRITDRLAGLTVKKVQCQAGLADMEATPVAPLPPEPPVGSGAFRGGVLWVRVDDSPEFGWVNPVTEAWASWDELQPCVPAVPEGDGICLSCRSTYTAQDWADEGRQSPAAAGGDARVDERRRQGLDAHSPLCPIGVDADCHTDAATHCNFCESRCNCAYSINGPVVGVDVNATWNAALEAAEGAFRHAYGSDEGLHYPDVIAAIWKLRKP